MIEIKSYAKINLDLYILKRQNSGYHEILTTMQKITLHDTINIDFNTDENIISVSGLNAQKIPTNSSNIALRAAEEYLKANKISEKIGIHIKKRIPTCAGLGGGSSNAAAVLNALNVRFSAMDFKDLVKIGKRIGADVSFFMHDYGAALCEGIGDVITSVKSGKYNFLLVQGMEKISTAEAYLNIVPRSKEVGLTDTARLRNSRLISFLPNSNAAEIRPYIQNDMLISAKMLAPSVENILEALQKTKPLFASMSGSGSACFACYESIEEATIAKSSFAYPWSHVCQSISE